MHVLTNSIVLHLCAPALIVDVINFRQVLDAAPLLEWDDHVGAGNAMVVAAPQVQDVLGLLVGYLLKSFILWIMMLI